MICIKKISDLWKNLYSEKGIKNVKDRVNDNSVGIYYNYSNNNGFEYDCLTGCEVKNSVDEIPENMIKIEIPKGRYVKFVIFGHPEKSHSGLFQKYE